MNPFNFLNKMSNNIKELLKKPNVHLDDVLKENEIVNEYKEQKEYVVNFFKEPQFQTLLKYLNKDHTKLEEKKKAYQFPQVAAEIFASGTKQVLEFFQQQKDNESINFKSLFEEFFNGDKTIKKTTINYTRAGYIQKVVNSLILKNPQFFAQTIYEDDKIFEALLQHSYSSSVTSILISLILNIQKKELQDENNKNNQVAHNEWLLKTNHYRTNFVKKILDEILQKQEQDNCYQKHKNLGLIIASIFKAEFSLKEEVLTIYYTEYFEKFANEFLNNFFEKQNQVTGTIFNIGLNYLQENMDQNYLTIDKLSYIILKYFETLNEYASISQQQFKKKISTFCKEVVVTNNNIYKFVSALAKFFDIIISNNKLEILQQNQIAENLVYLYLKHPFNNILHFKVTQVLQKIIDTKNENLVNYFFFQNLSFKNLLNQVVQDYKVTQENQAKVNCCYFGFIKDLQINLQNKGLFINQDDPYYDSFISEFFNKEANKENSIFTEIDSQKTNKDIKMEFYFSIEQIQQKFSNFLGLDEKSTEENQVNNEEEIEEEEQIVDLVDQEDQQQEQNDEDAVINKQELREELKNVMDQEETAFQDFKYWKKQDLHDIDTLISEYDI